MLACMWVGVSVCLGGGGNCMDNMYAECYSLSMGIIKFEGY